LTAEVKQAVQERLYISMLQMIDMNVHCRSNRKDRVVNR